MGEVQLLLCASNADVEQAPLLFQFRRIVEGLREREQAIFEARQKDDRILQPLGVVKGHQSHRVGRWIQSIGARYQHRPLQKMVEGRQAYFTAIVDHSLCSAIDQSADVLDPVARRFRAFRVQILDVTNLGDQLLEQDGSLAQFRSQSREVGERLFCRRSQRFVEVFARRDLREGDS